MSYEEIDRSIYGKDMFTNGAEGRYAKPKSTLPNDELESAGKPTETKKKTKKIALATTDNSTEQPSENGLSNGVVKAKKKTRKTVENGETQNDNENQVDLTVNDETVAKPKKKRAPKVESTDENIDPVSTTNGEAPVKKKKAKAPKATTVEQDIQIIDSLTVNELEQVTTDTPVKVKKPKKSKAPKTSTEPSIDIYTDTNNSNDYATTSEYNGFNGNDNAYGSTNADMIYDGPPPYSMEDQQMPIEPEKSEYESAILQAFGNLGSTVDFKQYVGGDQWCILHLPKSARTEPKSRIRKMLPGSKDSKSDGKSSNGKPPNQKLGFFNRFRSGVSTLVNDENNLLFGEQSPYELAYFEDEEDGVDTDDLHRYAQKLRELEDQDREYNPEFLVLRDGKTVYAVQETDSDGKMKLSKRNPIYDRFGDQALENGEVTEKRNLLSRLRNPFSRNKDKDNKNINSPKSAPGTSGSNRKRTVKKSSNKTTDDGMATTENSELAWIEK